MVADYKDGDIRENSMTGEKYVVCTPQLTMLKVGKLDKSGRSIDGEEFDICHAKAEYRDTYYRFTIEIVDRFPYYFAIHGEGLTFGLDDYRIVVKFLEMAENRETKVGDVVKL